MHLKRLRVVENKIAHRFALFFVFSLHLFLPSFFPPRSSSCRGRSACIAAAPSVSSRGPAFAF
jgi:hypothetical protein